MSSDLFSHAILNALEKKYEKERSPKRQKMDVKPIFQSKNHSIATTPRLMVPNMLRIQENLPFELISKVNSSKNLHSPPGKVVWAEGNDSQSCVTPGAA